MKWFVFLITIVFLSPLSAQEMDQHTQNALQETQELLTNKNKRDAATTENEQTKAADQFAKSLGTETDQMYELSAEILADIVKRTNGDPKKLRELIEEAQRDPATFGQSLNSSQKDKIRELAKPIPAPAPGGS